jgi:FdhD protein
MQILIAGPGQEAVPLSVTMRTPGHDFELAVGFVLTEGVTDREGIASVDYCEARGSPDPETRYNHVAVRLTHPWEPEGALRYFAASASCGTCGKASIDQIETNCPSLTCGEQLPASLFPALPGRLRKAQKSFDRTGGLHAAGLFDSSGLLMCAREDVGRHNAVDKVVGWTILSRPTSASPAALTVSGRVSFEIVQKAAVAGIGIIAAVSAPSSLAVDAADRLGVTLTAFVRGDSFNVYSHPRRIDFDR